MLDLFVASVRWGEGTLCASLCSGGVPTCLWTSRFFLRVVVTIVCLHTLLHDDMESELESDLDAENQGNKNASLMARGAGTFYLLATLVVLVVLSLTIVDPGTGLTHWPRVLSYLHIAHGVLTFYSLHWRKGSSVEADQGMYDEMTFWEQLDGGHAWTNSKRFLTLVPVGLFLATLNAVRDEKDYWNYLYPNVIVAVLSVVPKLPCMYKVRAFGINKTKYD